MHPIVAPFTSFFATQSRLLRLSAFVLQINMFVLCINNYFGRSYRVSSIRPDEQVIDQVDMNNIARASIVSSVLLLPFISEPLCSLLSNTLVRVTSEEASYVDEI